MTSERRIVSFLVAMFLVVFAPAVAQPDRFDLGLRANIVGGSGKPANDILGLGFYGHYKLSETWSVGFALDHSPEFDVERIASLVGLEQDPNESDIDATATSSEFKGWIERTYRRPSGHWEWFWAAGIGIGLVDVDDMAGPLADGGTFDIATDASTEFIVTVSIGGRRWLAANWGLEAALRGEQHFADWEYMDRISGATGTSNDFLVRGVHLAVLRRF